MLLWKEVIDIVYFEFYLFKRINLYEISNVGLVGFSIEPMLDVFNIRQIFIPTLKRYREIGSDLDYIDLYPGCR